MDKKEIAFFLKKRRKQLNITQEELAILSNVSVRKISDIETGKNSTTINTINKVCDVLGVQLSLEIKGIN